MRVQTLYSPFKDNAFGHSVAMSPDGRYLVVGAPRENEYRGAVYIYRRNILSDEYQFIQRLSPDTLEIGDCFGASVSLGWAAMTIVVGAPAYARVIYTNPTKLIEENPWYNLEEDDIIDIDPADYLYTQLKPGDVYFFNRNDELENPRYDYIVDEFGQPHCSRDMDPIWPQWEQVQKKTGEKNGELHGWSVSICQTNRVVAVGAPFSGVGTNYHGRVYMYDRYELPGPFDLIEIIPWAGNTDISGLFGYSVGVMRNIFAVPGSGAAENPFKVLYEIYVGAPAHTHIGGKEGSVYIWHGYIDALTDGWDSEPKFNQALGLVAGEILGNHATERFGHSLSVTLLGNRLAVGGPDYATVTIYNRDVVLQDNTDAFSLEFLSDKLPDSNTAAPTLGWSIAQGNQSNNPLPPHNELCDIEFDNVYAMYEIIQLGGGATYTPKTVLLDDNDKPYATEVWMIAGSGGMIFPVVMMDGGGHRVHENQFRGEPFFPATANGATTWATDAPEPAGGASSGIPTYDVVIGGISQMITPDVVVGVPPNGGYMSMALMAMIEYTKLYNPDYVSAGLPTIVLGEDELEQIANVNLEIYSLTLPQIVIATEHLQQNGNASIFNPVSGEVELTSKERSPTNEYISDVSSLFGLASTMQKTGLRYAISEGGMRNFPDLGKVHVYRGRVNDTP